MAYDLPTIPGDKIMFFREQLYRELASLFKWDGLPDEIPVDYMERTLIRHGRVMFFNEPETYGYMAIRCSIRLMNVYEQPVIAYSVTPNQAGERHHREKTIFHSYSKGIDPKDMCVLIENMESGQPINQIVDFYALRMAMVFQAFDTNALWQNVPQIFRVNDSALKLSIEKLFADVMKGKPFIITDKNMLGSDGSVVTEEINTEFRLDKLMDTFNELKQKFYETVGIDTPGADKKERLLTGEVESNKQATQTALDVMLKMRKKACEEITMLYPDLNPSVDVNRPQEEPEESELFDDGGENDDGTSDDGTPGRAES